MAWLGVMHYRDVTFIACSSIATQQVSFWAAKRGIVFMLMWAMTSQAVEVVRFRPGILFKKSV